MAGGGRGDGAKGADGEEGQEARDAGLGGVVGGGGSEGKGAAAEASGSSAAQCCGNRLNPTGWKARATGQRKREMRPRGGTARRGGKWARISSR